VNGGVKGAADGAADGGPGGDATSRASAVVRAWLADSDVEHTDGARPGEVVVRLPGEHRLSTTVSVLVGDHSVGFSAFVVRHADENHEAVMRWLLRCNSRLRGVAFALDGDDDVYLVARLPVEALTADSLDELMGTLLSTADDAFDQLLRLGFASAIRREAGWRAARGLDDTNLAAFRSLVDEQPG
jgi:hypothetical protein